MDVDSPSHSVPVTLSLLAAAFEAEGKPMKAIHCLLALDGLKQACFQQEHAPEAGNYDLAWMHGSRACMHAGAVAGPKGASLRAAGPAAAAPHAQHALGQDKLAEGGAWGAMCTCTD